MRIVGNGGAAFIAVIAAAIAAAIAACGGSSLEQPEPLSVRFDDMHIAAVPIEEKQAIFEANNNWSVAKAERAKAQIELDDVSGEIEEAKNELEKAKLDEETAEAKKTAADKSADMNRVNAAAVEVRSALLAKRAVDFKIQYLEAQRNYLAAKLVWAEQNMYASEAAYYLAMARIAQEKNIRPPGFKINEFETQARQRSESAQRLKALSERDKKTADAARAKWQESKKAATEASNTGS